MQFKRGITRFVATLTTVSLLLPIALFALTSGPATASTAPAATTQGTASVEAGSGASVVTLQARDLLGLLNGEIGGIPQFGLATDVGLGRWSPTPLSASLRGATPSLASRIDAVHEAHSEISYAATPLTSENTIGLPSFALAHNPGDDVLLTADGQASAAYKLTAPASMPSLITTPLQILAARTQIINGAPATTGALTIKDLMDGAIAAVQPTRTVSRTVVSGITHAFGSMLTAQKPTVDASPFASGWATVVFVPFTVEQVTFTFSSVPPAWMAVWLSLLIGLAGLVAVFRAQRNFSFRSASLVILKREQRE